MITKFKIYETLNQDAPEKGDYVIINWGYTILDAKNTQKLRDHIENSVGKVIDYGITSYLFPQPPDKYDAYYIKYENLPRENKIIQISKQYIKYWSKNKEELELMLASKKYNL